MLHRVPEENARSNWPKDILVVEKMFGQLPRIKLNKVLDMLTAIVRHVNVTSELFGFKELTQGLVSMICPIVS